MVDRNFNAWTLINSIEKAKKIAVDYNVNLSETSDLISRLFKDWSTSPKCIEIGVLDKLKESFIALNTNVRLYEEEINLINTLFVTYNGRHT